MITPVLARAVVISASAQSLAERAERDEIAHEAANLSQAASRSILNRFLEVPTIGSTINS